MRNFVTYINQTLPPGRPGDSLGIPTGNIALMKRERPHRFGDYSMYVVDNPHRIREEPDWPSSTISPVSAIRHWPLTVIDPNPQSAHSKDLVLLVGTRGIVAAYAGFQLD